jgi:glyoxylase-like metal-dependent hydrolase (beta-lactamase superfamily II)
MRSIISLLACLILVSALTAQSDNPKTPRPLTITHLIGDLYVYITYGDPGNGQPYPSNSLYMVTTDGIVLFDTPWDTTQCQPLFDSLYARHHQKPIFCLSTHFHSDRTAGIDFLKEQGVSTWSSQQTKEFCRLKGEPQAEHVFTKDTVFVIGGHSFRTMYPGEGHTKDNIVVWLEKEKVLYGGCFVKSTETQSLGNLSDANTAAWPASVKRVMHAFPHPAYVIPGHLGWADNTSLSHTLTLLNALAPID